MHDIVKGPTDDLVNSYYIIIASNAIHATHSLTKSIKIFTRFYV